MVFCAEDEIFINYARISMDFMETDSYVRHKIVTLRNHIIHESLVEIPVKNCLVIFVKSCS